MLCLRYGLPTTRASHLKLARLHFEFGHKYVLQNGTNLWGTDSRYNQGSCTARRDMLWLKGSANRHALCCETVCFIHVSNMDSLDAALRSDVDLVLVRWLEPHPSTFERDVQGFPLCPGPLHINNCLWKYSRTPRASRYCPAATPQVVVVLGPCEARWRRPDL